ncbi:glutamyl-tRNA(Gln) amidotransferase subunit D [Thermocladium modestius]|uniref:Glutamyl-tRNA(Gln) amidotransferase subunit D n=2 Tax=Thermocladium modestius TaxID=62609 RepID=A0A830GXM7_9CREN|nr:glutamyl-tRNA(Gln) amidotransferase subunit D [Thermocladium modestius]
MLALAFFVSYSDKVNAKLREFGAVMFSKARIRMRDGEVIEGIILPRPDVGDPDVVIIKHENGYNVGVHVDGIGEIEVLQVYSPPTRAGPRPSSGNGPRAALIATGGTIMSKVDYATGAVYPSFSLDELYEMYPELRSIASVELINLFSIFSEDMNPSRWTEMGDAINKAMQGGAEGIVVLHGTDTMHYSAAAMSFAFRSAAAPIVFTGSQRSSDRPSSDSFENIYASVLASVKAPFAESVVSMHASSSDGLIAIHRGVRARKMHSSRRDAFVSINAKPIAFVDVTKGELKMAATSFKQRGETVYEGGFDDRVALIKYYPGMDGEVIDYLVDRGYHGIVIEGTGFGHVSESVRDALGRAVEAGLPVVVSTQTIYGRVNLNVYRRGVELEKLGVIPSGDMSSETAYAKLSWILARTRDLEEVRRLVATPMAFELSERTEPINYCLGVS